MQNALYQKYHRMLFGVCMRYASSKMEAEDILQDGFILIYRDLYQYKPSSSLGAWCRRVMINVALQHIRKNKRLFPTLELTEVADTFRTEADILGKFRAEALIKLVQKLPEGYRAVFNLYVIEGFSHHEIGDALGITPETSRSQFSRAKAALRKMLEKNIV